VAIVSVGSNPVAQGAEEPRVTGGEFSAGAHSSRVRPARAKIPRAKVRVVEYTGKAMERFEKWLQSLNSRDQFRLALLCGLVETTLVFGFFLFSPRPRFATQVKWSIRRGFACTNPGPRTRRGVALGELAGVARRRDANDNRPC
jgi:hypothetical protein